MTDEQSMIRAVLADPADDVPRLVYADWLDEHSWPERAEFIRDCCGVLQQHTDCPVRLADIKGRRPVPLRCGVCEYCVARRRGERYYASHRWLDGHSYAVAFEPTPLDGDLPTGPGATLVVRRGFVSEVRCTLATLFGGPCGRCDVAPGVRRYPTHSGDWIEDDCNECSGTGRTPGIAADLFGSQPVGRVTPTDREPNSDPPHDWDWWDDRGMGQTNHPFVLPAKIFDRLPGGRVVHPRGPYIQNIQSYHTREAALSALSAACVARGRELAGLPVLKGVTT